MKAISILVLALLLGSSALAQSDNDSTQGDGQLDAASAKALLQTQELLKNKAARKKAISKSPDAKRADDFVRQLTGDTPVSDDIYALAADVFAQLVKDTKGDPVKMKEAIDKFQKNPEAFAEHWTPEQKRELHELANKLTPTVKPK